MFKIILAAGVVFTMFACSNAQEEISNSSSNESSSSTSSTQQTNTVVDLVSPAKFKELLNLEGAQVVDVRTPREYAGGKIGDAQNIDFFASDFKSKIDKLDRSKPVLVYCAVGGRSAKAVHMMKSMGFTEIHELQGGYNAWK
jgi:rhodanese-related sulfurtransferase